MKIIDKIVEEKIYGIIREDDEKRAFELACAYIEGGIKVIELNSSYGATKKIVDKFDDVVENLRKYAKLPVQIRLKYILIKGVNDNIEEISKYIELMKDIGIKISELVLDQCDPDFQNGDDFIIPPHYYELYEFWENKCKEYDIYPSLWSYLREILDRGKFFK